MAVGYDSKAFTNTQQFYSQEGVTIDNDFYDPTFKTRLVEVEIDCISRIPAMLYNRARYGEQVLPCLALVDIDGTILGHPPRYSIPPKTIDTVNWLLSQRDIHVIAVTSRLLNIIKQTENELKAAGIRLVSDTNPVYADDLNQTLKDKLSESQGRALCIQNNVVYVSARHKGKYVEQLIKALERKQAQVFGSVVFVDNTEDQVESVTRTLFFAQFRERKTYQTQICCYLNVDLHSDSSCTCSIPEETLKLAALRPKPRGQHLKRSEGMIFKTAKAIKDVDHAKLEEHKKRASGTQESSIYKSTSMPEIPEPVPYSGGGALKCTVI
ncbi:DUF2608 domain-containing protein [Sansalvadorimonas verongulae]|uniref:DUF2608 domain-containing protein n=1 Tax=Sansalvadorimonas verongulae TaxID=2172824 RepID=UPI0012BBA23E|nr:DUF2608 domain-containing protein [Sansalvadorimonas verongulae]MTI13476.1 DUF2608 domain-containing protein [Sansalvadorimonas verongulae]